MIGSFIKRRPTVWDAYVLSWVSLVCTVAAFFAGLVIAISARSAATLGYALENWVDSLSSILVLWRFWGGGKTVPEEQLAQREKRASIAIAITFVFLAVAVVSVAGVHFEAEHGPEEPFTLMMLSIPSMVVFGVLGVAKLWIGDKSNLDSPSLRKDGLCSVCGSVLSMAVLLASALQYSGNEVWWLDGAAAVVISAGLMAVGLRTVVRNIAVGNRFWTLGFWVEAPSGSRPASPLVPETAGSSSVIHNAL